MSWSRACVIELGDAQNVQVSDYVSTIPGLRDELQSPRPSNGPHRRLILIELCAFPSKPEDHADSGINIQLQDTKPLSTLEEVLTDEHLRIPDGFIDGHLQLGTRYDFNEDIRIPGLPSDLRPHEQYHLEYFEPRYFIPTRDVFPEDDETWTAVCASTGRAIQCHEWKSGNMLVIASRKVSFWSQRYEEDGGWDAIILCDPLNEACIIQDTTRRQLTPSRPFKNGFNIATGRPSPAPGSPPVVVHRRHHPDHDSMIGDLRFYFSHHADRLRRCLPPRQLADPSAAATLFARKVVAAHYNHMLAFVHHQTASMRSRGWSLRRANPAEAQESRAVEGQWSRFRCAEFVEALASTLESLGLPRYYQPPQLQPAAPRCCGGCCSKPKRAPPPAQRQRGGQDGGCCDDDDNDSSETVVEPKATPQHEHHHDQLDRESRAFCGDWAAVDRDLQHLYRGFEQQRIEYDRITHSIAAFVQMKEAERSLNVAKLTTYFALILTPFAWLAGFFSMDKPYLPGGEYQYVYWVVSVGVIVVSMILFQTGNEIKINDKKVMLAARRLGTGWRRNRRGRGRNPGGEA